MLKKLRKEVKMTITEICVKLSKMNNIYNEKVYVIDYDKYKVKPYTLNGFVRIDEGGSHRCKYVKYAVLEVGYPEKDIRVPIDKLYGDEKSAIDALNSYIDGQIEYLEDKKL